MKASVKISITLISEHSEATGCFNTFLFFTPHIRTCTSFQVLTSIIFKLSTPATTGKQTVRLGSQAASQTRQFCCQLMFCIFCAFQLLHLFKIPFHLVISLAVVPCRGSEPIKPDVRRIHPQQVVRSLLPL